jgi:hypothetical protein
LSADPLLFTSPEGDLSMSSAAAETGPTIFSDANPIAPNRFVLRKLRRFMSACLLPYCALLVRIVRVFHFYCFASRRNRDGERAPNQKADLLSIDLQSYASKLIARGFAAERRSLSAYDKGRHVTFFVRAGDRKI